MVPLNKKRLENSPVPRLDCTYSFTCICMGGRNNTVVVVVSVPIIGYVADTKLIQ